jgi:hypothetical protein
MTIATRAQVRAAVERALQLDPDTDAAIAATAAALALPVEAVQEALEPIEEQAA